MGITYKHYLLPAPADWDYHPDGGAVARLVQGLVGAGCAEGTTPEVRAVDVQDPDGKLQRLTVQELATRADTPQLAWRLALPAKEPADDYEHMLRRLKESLCFALEDLSFSLVCTNLPMVSGGLAIPCPGCQGDLALWRSEDVQRVWPRSLQRLKCEASAFATTCPGCQRATDPRDLAGTGRHPRDGSPFSIPTPISRVRLEADLGEDIPVPRPPRLCLDVAPVLHELLEAATGVAWRSIGSWS